MKNIPISLIFTTFFRILISRPRLEGAVFFISISVLVFADMPIIYEVLMLLAFILSTALLMLKVKSQLKDVDRDE